MTTITREEAVKRMFRTNGRIFKAVFRKKNGQFRRMVCRLGVKKYVTGKGLKYAPKDYGLICVFDMLKGQYRMVNVNSLMYLQVNKTKYKVEGGGK